MTSTATRSVLKIVWVMWIALGIFGVEATEADSTSEERRIVVVADIHGALEPLRIILRQADLIDEEDEWIGGSSVLVQTGDILDRGTGARGAAELLQSLQKKAERQGGEVVVLLGNHETLNLTMDLRDVTSDIAAAFARKRSEKRRNQYCDRLTERWRKRLRKRGKQGNSKIFSAECRENTPAGLLEYVEALEPGGSLGRWLRRLPIIAEVDGWLFVHGGLSEVYAESSVDELNRRVSEEIARFDRLRGGLLQRGLITSTTRFKEIVEVSRALHQVSAQRGREMDRVFAEDLASMESLKSWAIFDPDGPLWFRGYARWSDEEGEEKVSRILTAQQAKGVVVGHTPQKSRSVTGRFDNRIWLIDTGMLAEVYGGRPSALEILGDRLTAIYPDERQPLAGPKSQ